LRKDFTVIELFAGAGGLALGLEHAGFKTLALNEKNKWCCSTLRKNRPNWNIIEKPVEEVVSEGIKKYFPFDSVDTLSGGYPCQSFSTAGKGLGFEDIRGTMLFYYLQVLEELKPRLCLLENVRGLLSHDKGATMKVTLDMLEKAGYFVTHSLLNAVDFNVGQRRERVVIVGIRKDLPKDIFTFPKKSDRKLSLREVLKDVPSSPCARYSAKRARVMSLVPPGGYWKHLPDDVARDYMGASYFSGGGRTGLARKLSWDEPSHTLMCSPSQKLTERCHPEEVRPLSIREYARVQSFPDGWEFCGSMQEQYRQIGNAVPVNFARALGQALLSSLEKINKG